MSAPSPPPPPKSLASTLAALALLVAWAFALTLPALSPASPGAVSLWGLRGPGGWRTVAAKLLAWVAVEALRFAPLGFLAVMAVNDRDARWKRVVFVAFPAFVLALAVAVAVGRNRAAAAVAPGPSDFLVPALGIGTGVLFGLAWRRGWWARILFLPRLLVAAAVLLAAGGVLVLILLDPQPLVASSPAVTSADKRHLVASFRGKNPHKIPPGEHRTLRLDQHDVDLMAAWGLPLVLTEDRGRAQALLGAGDRLTVQASARLPFVRRWLNLVGSGRVRVDGGVLDLREPRLRVGGLEMPGPLMDALAPALASAVRHERRLRSVWPAIERLRVEPGAIEATYGHMETPPGFLASLVWGEGESGVLGPAVAVYLERLLHTLPGSPKGDARFALALQTAFALAHERSRPGSAVDENRGALLALGIVLGHPRVAAFVGEGLDEDEKKLCARIREGATLRSRNDWVRHFTLSGALTVLSAVAPSDAAGLLKEELDADGGSGFSFADLLADRSGTTFAALATRDEPAAAAVQDRLASGFRVDDFFPDAAGLPEGIPDRELQARYGGVGGELYRKYAGEVERRVGTCPAYRAEERP